jgi:AraC family ethanolamine operon transcriptional activator
MVKTQVYRDFEAFAGEVRDVDVVMMLQNPRRHLWSINHINLPGMHIQLGRLGSGNIVEGQSWSNGYLLYLPLTNYCQYVANGTAIDKHGFMVLEPGSEFCVSTKDEHDWCTIFAPADKLADAGYAVEASSSSDKPACRVTRPDAQIANQFSALVRQTMVAAANCSTFETSPAATCAAADALRIASLVLGKRQTGEWNTERRPKVPRQEIIRRCEAFLEERDGEPVLVGNLAAESGVSERTLRAAFNEYYGVGPVRYLQLRQLHRIRRVLREAGPDSESVTDVLARHGVWQFGRFAAQYRRLFGELPSETLRTK